MQAAYDPAVLRRESGTRLAASTKNGYRGEFGRPFDDLRRAAARG